MKSKGDTDFKLTLPKLAETTRHVNQKTKRDEKIKLGV